MTEPHVITVCKADPTVEPIAPTVLSITADLPQFAEGVPEREWRRQAIDTYDLDAQKIMLALNALPQGTRDQLLLLMLEHRASLLRVPVIVNRAPLDLTGDPPIQLRAAVATLFEEISRDRSGLAPVSVSGAVESIWFSLRTAGEEK